MRQSILLLTMGLLLAVLSACTGSREEPTRALLAASLNLAGGTSEIRFFQSSSLQPGSLEPLRRVGSWVFSEPIVDLLYRRSLGVGNDQLWVLTPSHLRRYLTSSLTMDNVGTPQLDDGFDQALNVDCTRGYLRQGQSHVLLVCPPAPATPPHPIEEYRAWIIPFTATALPSPVDFLDPNLVRLTTPVQLTLGPRDQLLYLTPRLFGQFDFINLPTERSLPQTNLAPTDLILVGGLGFGLLDDSRPDTTDTTLVSWNLFPEGEVSVFTQTEIAARRFARGAPPILVFGRGLAWFEGGFQLPRAAESGLLRTRPYSTAISGIDQFLYIAQQDHPTLWVVDLTVRMDHLTSAGVRSSWLGSLPERITGLAFIPVE